MWAFRPDERHARERRDRERTVGIAVWFPNGVRHFIPGGDPKTAMTLARNSPAAEFLDHPATRIEFGTAEGRSWVCERVLKAPAGG